jgi:hypothetical protein
MELINALVKLKIPSLVAIFILLYFGSDLLLENNGDIQIKYIGAGFLAIGVIFSSIFIFNRLQSDKYEKVINNLEKVNKSLTANISDVCKTNRLFEKSGRDSVTENNTNNTRYKSENQESSTET